MFQDELSHVGTDFLGEKQVKSLEKGHIIKYASALCLTLRPEDCSHTLQYTKSNFSNNAWMLTELLPSLQVL